MNHGSLASINLTYRLRPPQLKTENEILLADNQDDKTKMKNTYQDLYEGDLKNPHKS